MTKVHVTIVGLICATVLFALDRSEAAAVVLTASGVVGGWHLAESKARKPPAAGGAAKKG